MKSLTRENQADIIEAFISTSRYLDDLLNIDNIYFEHMVGRIYQMAFVIVVVFINIQLRPRKKICVFPVSRPTLIFRATLNILLHF